MKKILQWLFAERGTDAGLLLVRLVAGGMMMTHGWAKIQHFTQLSQTFADPIGLGAKASLILIIFAEFGCSILLALGLLTRLAAIPLIIGMIVAAFFTHPEFALGQSELALLYLAIVVAFLIMGAGRYSLDHLIRERWVSTL